MRSSFLVLTGGLVDLAAAQSGQSMGPARMTSSLSAVESKMMRSWRAACCIFEAEAWHSRWCRAMSGADVGVLTLSGFRVCCFCSGTTASASATAGPVAERRNAATAAVCGGGTEGVGDGGAGGKEGGGEGADGGGKEKDGSGEGAGGGGKEKDGGGGGGGGEGGWVMLAKQLLG